MKDLEKIKSEDLAAQVQDANPANFAIEQEVAQLVGATVPSPTEPSADDARELGAQLLVFLRRALTPIQTALRTAVAAIYAHLDSRCTDYTPAAYAPFTPTHHAYDPMGSTHRTLPNLLTALTAFADRKISGVPEAADGISLVNLIANPSEITELTDPNKGWTMGRNNLVSTLVSIFSGLDTVTLGCGTSTQPIAISVSGLKHLNLPELEDSAELADRCANIESIYIPKLKHCQMAQNYGRHDYYFIGYNKCTDIDAPELESFGGPVGLWGNSLFRDLPNCKKISAPKLTTWNYQYHHSGSCAVWNCPELEELDFRSIRFSLSDSFTNCPKLIKLVLTLDYSQSLALWEPTLDETNLDQFLLNFKNYIALRLTANGSGKTLTLSQAVRNAIHAAESTYGIENIIVTQKGWRIQPDAS